MFKKYNIVVLSGLLLIGILFTFTCTLPLDPLKNPDVVEANIFVLDQEVVEGMPASFGVSLTYPMHVCSVVVSFDENRANDTSVYCKTKEAQPETLVVKFAYSKENALQIIKAVVKLTNGKVLEIETIFKVRKKNLEVKFVSIPKPHLAPVNESDTLQFIASKNPAGGIIIFNSSSEPSLDSNHLQLISRGDTALLIVTPMEEKMCNIYCYATYVYALDTGKVAITSYGKPKFSTSSGGETQITGTADTLFFALPSNSTAIEFELLDSGSYDTRVLSTITNDKGKKTYKFKPNEIKTYSFSFLVKKDNLTDTITYQRMVIEMQSMKAPQIKTHPDSQIVDPLGNVTFGVLAEGSGLNYQWQKDGKNIEGAISQTYIKSKIVFTDEGQYQCVVSNEGGSVTSAAAKLTVNKTLTDADGNVYDLVIMGTQVWTVDNFRCTKYNDKTPIPHVTDSSAWGALTTPAYCFYDNRTDPTFKKMWGALYNWYAVNTKKLAPDNWHVPTDADWTTLEKYLIANLYNYDGSSEGNKIAKALAANKDWKSSTKTGAIGNNQSKNNASGFSAVPGGFRNDYGNFYHQGSMCVWWSATESYEPDAWYRSLDCEYDNLSKNVYSRSFGCSVRLVRDY